MDHLQKGYLGLLLLVIDSYSPNNYCLDYFLRCHLSLLLAYHFRLIILLQVRKDYELLVLSFITRIKMGMDYQLMIELVELEV